jgi:radical SAM protein with 4Fe4S-binding SPASM domain
MMPLERYCEILDQCRDLTIAGSRITSIRLDGSREALLYPYLSDAIIETKRCRLGTQLTTNGTLLTRENVQSLIDSGLDKICISATGISPEVYGKFQGSGSPDVGKQFYTVATNVLNLAEARDLKGGLLHISVSYIVTDESVVDAGPAVFFWKNNGVDDIVFYDDINEVDQAFLEGKRLKYRKGSKQCMHTVTIASNGDVYPCCKVPGEEIPLGNCFITPLTEIFTSEIYFSFVDKIARLDISLLPPGCKTCPSIARIDK